ncbi:hypothetical protein EOL70_13345 [Leucothrix sargassi]|nr:hypothetical protein EOL70_13345 [Leucothrix sargassi]
MPSSLDESSVLRLVDTEIELVKQLLEKYGLSLTIKEPEQTIPGSFWGDEEAGLIADTLYARTDTPIHSILHEACHYICMSESRRKALHTNAGGTQDEENAVCYLQLILCKETSFISQQRMMQDMDAWGYNFMLGSTKAWFESDATDAMQWLLNHQLINEDQNVTFSLRQ